MLKNPKKVKIRKKVKKNPEKGKKKRKNPKKPSKGWVFSGGLFRVFSGGFFRAGFFNPNPDLCAMVHASV